MDAQIRSLQRMQNPADSQQLKSLAELRELKNPDMPLPPYFFVGQGLTALRTHEGIDALKIINPYIDPISANMIADKLAEQGSESFVLINQTFRAIQNSSNAEIVSCALEQVNRLKVPVMLYMGGALHLINSDITVDQLFNEAKEPARLVQLAKEFRVESLEEIRDNQRLQLYLQADFGMSPNLLEQLLALPDLQQIGIINCPAGTYTKDFAKDLKHKAASEGMPICFSLSYGSSNYLVVVEADTNVEALFKKLESYSNEARDRSERLLDKAVDQFLVYDQSLAQPENMLKWLASFKESDFYIYDQDIKDSIALRAAGLGYTVARDDFISDRMFDPERTNQICAYLLEKTDQQVDRLIIAYCLHEIIESGSLSFGIEIPRRAEIQQQQDKM